MASTNTSIINESKKNTQSDSLLADEEKELTDRELCERYDLTNLIGQYLDKHLIYPLLEFLQTQTDIYDNHDLLKALLELLSKTKMIDDTVSKYNSLHNLHEDTEPTQELQLARSEVISELHHLNSECSPLLAIFSNHTLINQLINSHTFTFDYLQSNHSITRRHLDSLFRYALLKYNCGTYADAADLLYYYLLLNTVSGKDTLSAMWGKLNCEILLSNYTTAIDDFDRLYDAIELRGYSNALTLTVYRAWLLHYALFIYFQTVNDLPSLIALYTESKYLTTIQTLCPYLLRYLVVALVITPSKRSSIHRELLQILKEEEEYYSDPFTRIIIVLFDTFDFEESRILLNQCEKLAQTDYFISMIEKEFISSLHTLFFESYSSIHHKIDIPGLAKILNLPPEKAEAWVIEHIRQHQLQHSQQQQLAKINSKDNQILINAQTSSMFNLFHKLNLKIGDTLTMG